MDKNHLLANYKGLIDQARAVANEWKGREAEMPAEVSTKIDELLGKADEIKAKIGLADRFSGADDFLGTPQDIKAAHLGFRPAGPDEGNAEVDPDAWRSVKALNVFGREIELRFQVPLAVQQKGYAAAFESYIRKGMDRVGPQDRKTLSEGLDTAGGFLVPEDFQTELIKKSAAAAAIRSLARVVQTSRDAVKWPKVNYTTDDIWTSGVRFTWTGETPASATVHRVTDPVFGLLNIPVHTAMASMPITNVLLEDSAFDIGGLSSDLLGEAFGLGEDNVFVNGTGVNQPMGMITRVTDATIGNVVTGHASTLLADGLIDLVYGLPAQYRRNAKLVMNSSTAKAIRKLKDGSNRYLWDAMQGQYFVGLGQTASPDSILGYGIAYDEFMPNVGAGNYPILFGDFTGYFIVDRVGFSLQRLSELYAETDITVLLARKRVGGDIAAPFRMKAQKVST